MTILQKTPAETERDTLLAKCRRVVDRVKSEGRDLTSAEQTAMDSDLATVKSLNERIKGERSTAQIMSSLDTMAADEEAHKGNLAPG